MPTHDPQHILEWWKETTLGEVVDITSSKRIFAEEYKSFGVPFYRGKEIIEKFNGWKISTELYITEEKYIEIESKFWAPKSGDMLLTSVWTIWIPYIVKNNERFYFKDWNLTWFRNFNGILNTFLFYWLTSGYWKEEIQRHKIWSTQEALTIVWLKSISIKLPPLPEQRAIADMLSSFDAKIELLRDQNETLEKTAQTIFQEWFGKYSIDDELPEGWRVGKFGEVVENFDSKRIPIASDKRNNWIYPYYGATWINDYVEKYIFDGIYTLLWEDGSVIKENGKPFTQYVWWKIWVNNHAHVLQWKNWFSTELIKIILDKTDIAPFVNGAVQLKINQTNMNSIPVIIPDSKALMMIDGFMQPIFSKLRNNFEQIQSLSKTRDELLPRLMSGKVRVGI